MEFEPLPPDLEELERRLKQRRCEAPAATLRNRVIVAVGSETRRVRTERFWRSLAIAAAVALFWLNVSLSASNATDVPMAPVEPQDSMRQLTLMIEEVLPELSHEEARRQAILYRAGIELVPCPDVAPRTIDPSTSTKASS